MFPEPIVITTNDAYSLNLHGQFTEASSQELNPQFSDVELETIKPLKSQEPEKILLAHGNHTETAERLRREANEQIERIPEIRQGMDDQEAKLRLFFENYQRDYSDISTDDLIGEEQILNSNNIENEDIKRAVETLEDARLAYDEIRVLEFRLHERFEKHPRATAFFHDANHTEITKNHDRIAWLTKVLRKDLNQMTGRFAKLSDHLVNLVVKYDYELCTISLNGC